MGIFDQNENGSPSRGLSGRIIAGLIIVGMALFMYYNQSQENPITGEKQHVAISPSQEIRLGLESAPVMAQKMGGELPSDDPRVLEVRRIGQFIVANTDASKSPWKFQFHVLADTNTINAFALPGGQVFITLGLLNKLQNEAQLAGVLSHEMGHVIERHSAQQMAKSQLGEMIVSAVAVSASDPTSRGSYEPVLIASVVNHMFQLRYSRKDESQADIWGLKLMNQVGFDPTAMIDVMEILKSSGSRGHAPELFQTHPNPDLRIQQIKEYLKNHPPSPNVEQGKKLKAGTQNQFR